MEVCAFGGCLCFGAKAAFSCLNACSLTLALTLQSTLQDERLARRGQSLIEVSAIKIRYRNADQTFSHLLPARAEEQHRGGEPGAPRVGLLCRRGGAPVKPDQSGAAVVHIQLPGVPACVALTRKQVIASHKLAIRATGQADQLDQWLAFGCCGAFRVGQRCGYG